eukprot:3213283-Alexandrium_andersonii.AAC.1
MLDDAPRSQSWTARATRPTPPRSVWSASLTITSISVPCTPGALDGLGILKRGTTCTRTWPWTVSLTATATTSSAVVTVDAN